MVTKRGKGKGEWIVALFVGLLMLFSGIFKLVPDVGAIPGELISGWFLGLGAFLSFMGALGTFIPSAGFEF